MDTCWLSSFEHWVHCLDELDDLLVVLELVNVRFHLIDGLALLGNKLLVIHDVLFNSVEEQVHGFLLLLLNRGNVPRESLNVGWLVNLDIVVLALLDEELNSPLRLVAEFYPRCVW